MVIYHSILFLDMFMDCWGTLYREVDGVGWGILVAEVNYSCGLKVFCIFDAFLY